MERNGIPKREVVATHHGSQWPCLPPTAVSKPAHGWHLPFQVTCLCLANNWSAVTMSKVFDTVLGVMLRVVEDQRESTCRNCETGRSQC